MLAWMSDTLETPLAAPSKDMVWIAGGEFLMGSDDFYPEERPAHRVAVDGFWIDRHPVTVAEFRRFVKATGHVTWAELAPDPADYPGALPELLVPGSLVFTGSTGPVDLTDVRNWWTWIPGAQWRHPEGPGSTLHGRERHPVTHVAFGDAVAYADMGGQGPADRSRVGARRARRPRRKGLLLGRRVRTQGQADGEHLAGRVPVAEPRAGRLRADVAGRALPGRTATGSTTWPATSGSGHRTSSPRATPRGPSTRAARRGTRGSSHRIESYDLAAPGAHIPRRVTKGGSHLCAPNYCLRYRPAARQGEPVDSTTSHIGFRCVSKRGQ